jgi:hypothetical protein
MLSIALMAAFGICEIGLRILGASYPSFYRTNEYCCASLAPGVSGWQTVEGRAYVSINSQGLRDREHELKKPLGCVRVAVLGDSYCEALQVAAAETFWAVLEKQIQAQLPGQSAEVINFGCSGYGTAQELITWREDVRRYNPDLVLLAFLTGNDVTDNHRALKGSPMTPYFTIASDGSLTLDDSFKSCQQYRLQSTLHSLGMRELFNACRCLQLVNQARRAYSTHQMMAARAAPVSAGDGTPDSELGLDELIYLPPSTSNWREAWAVTERLIETMHQEVEEQGARFVLTTLSNGPQVLPDDAQCGALAKRLGAENLFYPDLRLRDFARQRGIPIVTLAPLLKDYAVSHQVYLHGFANSGMGIGHWNETGHRIAGELIAQEIAPIVAERSRTIVAQRDKADF